VSDYSTWVYDGWVGLDLVGVSDLRRKLGKLHADLDDFEPLWDDLTTIMQRHVLEWFETEGEGTWPALAPEYEAAKRRAGYTGGILVREGNLLASLLDPERARRIEQGRTTLGTFTKKVFTWSTDEPTAAYHTEGRDWPPMPPRPPLVVTPGLIAQVHEAAEDWLDDLVRQAGLEAE